MNILECLDGVIRKPAATFKVIAQEKPVGWALAIFAVTLLLSLVSTDYSAIEEQLAAPGLMVILQIIISIAMIFIMAGLLHLLARIFKGSGDYWGLFSVLGFAQFPGFLVPIAAVIRSVGGVVGAILGGIISIGAAIWVLVLYIIALRESHEITTGGSILTFILALVVLVVAVMIIMFIAIILAGSML